MKEKKTLLERSRFKGHKKVKELRLQASHITFQVCKCLYNTIKHLEKFPMCIRRASSIIFLGVRICENAKCFKKKVYSVTIFSLYDWEQSSNFKKIFCNIFSTSGL
jgi:hypothetical protein